MSADKSGHQVVNSARGHRQPSENCQHERPRRRRATEAANLSELAQQRPLAMFSGRHQSHFKRTRRRTRIITTRRRRSQQAPADTKSDSQVPKSKSSSLANNINNNNQYRLASVSFRWQATSGAAAALRAAIVLVAAALVVRQARAVPQQQQANSMGGLQQAMAQMLQVFNGNDSSQMEANHFKVFKLYDESLLVGARNLVYNLSLSTMREQRRIEWPSAHDDIHLCLLKGKTADQCQNYIKVVEMDSPSTLLVCGTNAYKPRCRSYRIEADKYQLLNEYSGEGACPYQETQNVTSLIADGQLYSATTAQFSGMDALIHRDHIRTEQFNPKQLNSPNFVSSFRYGEHVYFLFKEIAIEHHNCGKTIYSRIGRVCVNDAGGPNRAQRDRWTSFVKARLNCSVPGEFPFAFDEIQSSTQVVSSAYQQAAPLSAQSSGPIQQQQQDMVYAVFTTPQNSIGGSAVCAYRLADILAAFDGPFKAQTDGPASWWQPLFEGRVPQQPVRAGRCANDSRKLPDDLVSFIRDNPLMDKAVEPIWSQPLITMASINFRFTQIAVDAQVETIAGQQQQQQQQSMRTDVIFVATDDGRVFKLINTYHLQLASQMHRLQASAPIGYPIGPLAPMQSVAARLPIAQQQVAQQVAQQQQREPVVDVSASTVVIEELHLFDSRTPVVGLLLASGGGGGGGDGDGQRQAGAGKLIVASARQLKAIPLSRCERALSCADCLALYDPYCAWDTQLHLCQASGASMAPGNSASGPDWPPARTSDNEIVRAARQMAPQTASWFPANSGPTAAAASATIMSMGNRTLAWWTQSCPATGALEPNSVGYPIKSMFSSHLQVPSRFDYASGHHLSRAPLLFQAAQSPSTAAPIRQPVSECLTFCGASAGVVPIPQLAGGADYLSQQSFMMQQQQQQQQQRVVGGGGGYPSASLVATKESLYSTVIIYALFTLLLGSLLGFVLGKRSARSLCSSSSAANSAKHHDSSVCSSTFDETNLYMASTGSHQAAATLAALHQQSSLPQGHLFASQLMRNNNNNNHHHYHQTNAHQARAYASQQQQQDVAQSLLAQSQRSDSPPPLVGVTGQQQQQQLLLQLANNDHRQAQKGAAVAPSRTGALPLLPHQQQPLVSNANGPTTHINNSQLTPPTSSSGASSTNGSSSTAQMMQAAEQQMYLNQQQLLMATGGAPTAQARLHQLSFSGNQVASATKSNQNGANSSTSFQQQQQQQVNNKIYL